MSSVSCLVTKKGAWLLGLELLYEASCLPGIVVANDMHRTVDITSSDTDLAQTSIEAYQKVEVCHVLSPIIFSCEQQQCPAFDDPSMAQSTGLVHIKMGASVIYSH